MWQQVWPTRGDCARHAEILSCRLRCGQAAPGRQRMAEKSTPDKHVEVPRLVCTGRGFDSRRLPPSSSFQAPGSSRQRAISGGSFESGASDSLGGRASRRIALWPDFASLADMRLGVEPPTDAHDPGNQALERPASSLGSSTPATACTCRSAQPTARTETADTASIGRSKPRFRTASQDRPGRGPQEMACRTQAPCPLPGQSGGEADILIGNALPPRQGAADAPGCPDEQRTEPPRSGARWRSASCRTLAPRPIGKIQPRAVIALFEGIKD